MEVGMKTGLFCFQRSTHINFSTQLISTQKSLLFEDSQDIFNPQPHILGGYIKL